MVPSAQAPHTWGCLGCRKIRVTRETFYGSGSAGDLSKRTGAEPRVEDERDFRQQAVDSPTFKRFCQSLAAKPAVSPHQRRADAAKQAQAAAVQAAAQDVVQLDDWEVGQQQRQDAAAAAAAAAAAPGKRK